MKRIMFLLFFPAVLSAQIEATTADGKKVILRDDFTWQYAPVEKADPASLDCSDLIKVESDKVTGKETEYFQLIVSQDDKKGFGIHIFKVDNGAAIAITATGAGSCIDDDDKANILFRDGTRLETTNMAKFNCKGNFTLFVGPGWRTKKEAEALTTKEIQTLRVWTSDGYVEEDFTPEQSASFRTALACMLEK